MGMTLGYDSEFELSFDLTELKGLEKNVKEALSKGLDKKAITKNVISPSWILWKYGAPVAITVLMSHTPVGDNFSNWGYWDYGTYVVYGGDHAKGTLRRGWFTSDPSKAESDITMPETKQAAWDFISTNTRVRRSSQYHYYIDLVNCVPYGLDVEYGHRVVFPNENKFVFDENGNRSLRHAEPGGAWDVGLQNKGTAKGRWVPGQYFVREAMYKSNWQPVYDSMHQEYVKRVRRVFRK